MDLRVQLKSQHLNQQAEVARIESDYQQARLKADRNEILAREGLLADIDLLVAKSSAVQLGTRRRIEQERLDIQAESIEAQLAVQKAEVERLKALVRLRQREVEALRVMAGTEGVLQELSLQVGQHVTPGMILAKVAQPQRLMAQLRIAETQAKDIATGQLVQVDTRNGIIRGRVSRIDPTVKESTVTVDVKLEGVLPSGARPDMNVDGIIEIERLSDVLYVGRPAFGQPRSVASLFRLESDGRTAVRIQVEFGRSSVSIIEVLRGLQAGDTVVLSDMTAWDSHDRVVLR
jgi:HlyD family secretion protein